MSTWFVNRSPQETPDYPRLEQIISKKPPISVLPATAFQIIFLRWLSPPSCCSSSGLHAMLNPRALLSQDQPSSFTRTRALPLHLGTAGAGAPVLRPSRAVARSRDTVPAARHPFHAAARQLELQVRVPKAAPTLHQPLLPALRWVLGLQRCQRLFPLHLHGHMLP